MESKSRLRHPRLVGWSLIGAPLLMLGGDLLALAVGDGAGISPSVLLWLSFYAYIGACVGMTRLAGDGATAVVGAAMPDELLRKLDALADKRGTSRNRLIAEACKKLLERDLGEWPADFFSNDHVSEEELEELRQCAAEMTKAILAARRSRVEGPS